VSLAHYNRQAKQKQYLLGVVDVGGEFLEDGDGLDQVFVVGVVLARAFEKFLVCVCVCVCEYCKFGSSMGGITMVVANILGGAADTCIFAGPV
jgi:hypothetical protein